MEKDEIYQILGVILFLSGFLFLFNSQANILGAFIGVSVPSGLSSIFGFSFIIFGLALYSRRSRHYRVPSIDYYVKRANEITKYKGDIWISQWESEGLLNELKDRGYHIEHDQEVPAMHLGSKHSPSKRHVHIESDDKGVDKHLFISRDPDDPRIRTIGVKEKGSKLEKILSKTYHPMHPRKSGREKKKFTDKTRVT